MPAKQKDGTPNKTGTSDDIIFLETEAKRLTKAKGELQKARRLLAREQFLAIPRRQHLKPGEAITAKEAAAMLEWGQSRTIETRLEARRLIGDDWGDGRIWYLTDDLIQVISEAKRWKDDTED